MRAEVPARGQRVLLPAFVAVVAAEQTRFGGARMAALRREADHLPGRDDIDILRIHHVLDRHGMAEVAPGHAVAIEDMVDARVATRIANGQVVTFAPVAGREREAEAALLGRHDHYACWKKDAMPPQWRYGTHPRVAPIVCQMDEGWDAIPRRDLAKRPAHARGSHGFDPALPSMRAVFVANGPAFEPGATLPVFDNVDVYALLARLLGVAPKQSDGSADTFVPALR